MKSKKILIIVITAISILLVSGFITYYVLTKEKPLEVSDVKNASGVSANIVAPKYLNTNIRDLTLFENTSASILGYVNVLSFGDWEVEYTYDEDLIEIDNDSMLYTKSYSQDEVEVSITITPKFDYTKYSEFETKTFPKKEKFRVFVLPQDYCLSYSCSATDINNFNISIVSDKTKLKKDNISIDDANISLSGIAQNSEKVILNNVQIQNALQTNFTVSYTVRDDNSKVCTSTVNVNIMQDKKYIKYYFKDKMKNDNTLYLTKNNEYNKEYPNYASVVVNNNFDLLSTSCSLSLINGDQDGIDIDSTLFKAKKSGRYTIRLICCGVGVAEFSFKVQNIDITHVDFGPNEREIEINCELDLTITDDCIYKESELASYFVTYEILNDTGKATINNKNMFVATEIGIYDVKISVREFSQKITIKVTQTLESEFAFINEDKIAIKEVYVSISDIIGQEYSISCSPNKEISKDATISLSSTNSNYIYACYSSDAIKLMLDVENLSANEEMVINIQIKNNYSELVYSCSIKLIFV